MEYPKINSLWKRKEDHSFFEGNYSCPEFEIFKTWRVEEKIDGTNIRLFIYNFDEEHETRATDTVKYENKIYNRFCDIEMYGRTLKAQLNPNLIKWFHEIKLEEKIKDLPEYCNSCPLILYGEGFGKGIQSGGIYRKDVSFILFDAYMNGRWSTREEVKRFADIFGFETPYDFGLMTQEDIISFVKSKPRGKYGDCGYIIEGVVVRSEPLVRFNDRSANPVMWKLKCKDF